MVWLVNLRPSQKSQMAGSILDDARHRNDS